MASPVGHALAGLAIARAAGDRANARLGALGVAGLCAGLAIAPDLDFLPGLVLGRPALHHQGASHSLVAALLVGAAAAALVGRDRHGALGLWPIFGLAWASHLAIDWMGVDRRPPYGIPLLWPFTEQAFQAPTPWLPGIDHAPRTETGTAEWLGRIFSARNAVAIGVEVAFVAPWLVAAEWWRRRRARPEPS